MQGRFGIIGGSGLYDIPDLADIAWTQVDSPWGAPSDAVLTSTLGSVPLAF
jgi:5'-methylthioadenosine phosphorylase